ncbi:MAG: hypothetical protein IJZ39_05755 [Oscillospiraceae bacterium]|nr:hypothetical protein [Oscillospiraceae bacterium]
MHEQHSIVESDDHFEVGTLAHLVVGNTGRVLDGRRTPGYIESFDEESAMFVWRITAFEDKGEYWEIPAEEITSYQFRKGSPLLSPSEVTQISARCDALNQQLVIQKSETNRAATENAIDAQEQCAHDWIINNSLFYKAGTQFDFSAEEGNRLLFTDMENYLKELGLSELDRLTAEQYLLNPYSGEWIKSTKIIMAEMGLIAYSGTPTRKTDTFSGIGEKELRKRYIIARTAFLRSIFKLKGIREVSLFRGMSSSIDFYETPHTLVSTTFSAETALAFTDIQSSSKSRSAYFVKFTCPVDRLFMTFLETRQFSQRYKEQEAIIFYDGQIKF